MERQTAKVGSAIFYGLSSFLVIFMNKYLLSEFNFPHFIFLAGGQFLWTTVVIFSLGIAGCVEIPQVTFSLVKEVAPVSIMFFLNVVSGLGSTKSLNLPMFTVLRRFSILMTMVGEWTILGNIAESTVVASVWMMVLGAVVAAFDDLSFSAYGYTMILANDLFTALNGIYLKKATLSSKSSKTGILFMNSLLSFSMVLMLYVCNHIYVSSYALDGQMVMNAKEASIAGTPPVSMLTDVLSFPEWGNSKFCALFFLTTCMGTVLNWAIFLCTSLNSALTTTVIGCLKNILTTYLGMVLLSGYNFSWTNFIGINISIVGSVWYTYHTLFKPKKVESPPRHLV
jgi:solute carrier family 35 protein